MTRTTRILSSGDTLRLTANDKPGDVLILRINLQRAIYLTLTEDRLLYDSHGTYFACEDETLMVDTQDRPGVGAISLPADHWSSPAAKVHDFLTSCAIYQMTHPRSDAEEVFTKLIEQLTDTHVEKAQGWILTKISKAFSWLFWDNSETRWK